VLEIEWVEKERVFILMVIPKLSDKQSQHWFFLLETHEIPFFGGFQPGVSQMAMSPFTNMDI